MSEQIDWSKAPEWATKHGAIGVSRQPIWFNRHEYTYVNGQQGGRAFLFDGPGYPIAGVIDVTERPTTPSWSGEGLPPVGVVCEVNPDKAGWRKSVISYIGDGFVAWLQVGDLIVPEYGAFIDDCEFRPIRTHEQIAADERKHGILQMIDVFGKDTSIWGLDSVREICAFIYDAGYRKP